jgi:hypothetical protein
VLVQRDELTAAMRRQPSRLHNVGPRRRP